MTKRYTNEFKSSMIQKMLAPNEQSLAKLSKEHGVSEAALYRWRLAYQDQGNVVPEKGKTADAWSPANKLATVIETAALNEAELSGYCREKGLYTEQVNNWKAAALSGYEGMARAQKAQASTKRADLKQIRALQSELRTKDKALAETAALLVLSKKWVAIWEDSAAS